MGKRAVALVPELVVRDAAQSAAFYKDVLAFSHCYSRPAQGFYYLSHHGAELMLEQCTDDSWMVPGDGPLGRGIHLQIGTPDADALFAKCKASGARIFRAVETAWYRTGDVYGGQKQFVVLDPDGYMLRFAEDLGTRASAPNNGRIVE